MCLNPAKPVFHCRRIFDSIRLSSSKPDPLPHSNFVDRGPSDTPNWVNLLVALLGLSAGPPLSGSLAAKRVLPGSTHAAVQSRCFWRAFATADHGDTFTV